MNATKIVAALEARIHLLGTTNAAMASRWRAVAAALRGDQVAPADAAYAATAADVAAFVVAHGNNPQAKHAVGQAAAATWQLVAELRDVGAAV